MKLYVCYGTFPVPIRPGGHPCGNAYAALKESGHDPEVVRCYGLGILPDRPFNATAGRRRVKKLTRSSMVPVLELDNGLPINGSHRIIEWARAHPVEVQA